jgi:protein involved in polysaccharide export with SLBB domain
VIRLKANGLSHKNPVSEGAKLYRLLGRGVAMNRLICFFQSLTKLGSAVLSVGLACVLTAWAQKPVGYGYDHKSAVEQARSRAEQEADQLVSLSADKIISLLRDEPGLLLQIKKALVRKAFEQGRVIDSADLTDDGVFTLLREDEGTRVIATREIVDRYYISAKPTREELVKSLPCRQSSPPMQTLAKDQTSSAQSSAQSEQTKPTLSQEDIYWHTHEVDLDCYSLQTAPYDVLQSLYNQLLSQQVPGLAQFQQTQPLQYPQQQYPQQQYPQQSPQQTYPPSQTAPQNQQLNTTRQLQLTGLQPPGGNYFETLETDQSEMAQEQPGDLSSLVAAARSGGLSMASSKGMEQLGGTGQSAAIGGAGSLGLGGTMPSLSSLGSLLGMQGQGNTSGFPQPGLQASLQNPLQQLQPPYLPTLPLQPTLRHRVNPYADVPSLYDLYAQYSKRSPLPLERFGEDVFHNGTGNFDELPMDLPVGPEYVVGPGDGLTVDIWGGVSQRLQRVVDRSGRVDLPEVGTVEVSGKSLGDVQHMVQTVLRAQFRDVSADVSLARLRTVRVYVVGDVERPGAYDISALSTPLNALYQAGGPTSAGSLRILRHYRGKQLVQEVDVYDLLLHGIRADMQGLQPGDTIQIPPLGPEVTVEGMVRRPAIYELNSEKNLSEVLELAGGVMPTGTLRHVDVERVESHDSRTMLRLDIPEANNQQTVTEALENFNVQDGDKIKITPILPYADKTVYLDGHVSRPGKFAYREGMKVTDLIKSYKDLLPEPSTTHAEIIRLSEPDYGPTILAFNLGDALDGKDQDLVLKPFDTVRVFGRFDFEDPPVVTVTGEVRDPGDHLTNGVAHLRDAVYLAGGTTPDALLSDAQVFRKTSDGKLKVISVNLARALDGDAKDNVELEPKDRVFIHRDLNKLDPPTVTVEGEVARPGKYPLGEDMTAASLVRLAGGFKRGAYTQQADLTRYEVEEGSKVVSDHVPVQIAKALAGEPDTDVRLRDGDVLNIGEISGWQDLGAAIQVKGEVAHPGGYGIQPGERLSSIIARAGGFLPTAYPYGAILERAELREIELKNRAELIERIRAEAKNIKYDPQMEPDDKERASAAVVQYKMTIDNLENTPPAGRLVIHIASDVKRWANTTADVQVRAGDTIYIPKRPGMVVVQGAVFNPTGVTYKPGKSAGWYLRQAGGPTKMADRKQTFVVRADGSVVGGAGASILSGGVEHTELRAGDMVVVPEQVYGFSTKFKTTLSVAQIASSVGTAIAVATYYATH